MTKVRATKFAPEITTTSIVFTTASSLGAGAPAAGNAVVIAIEVFSTVAPSPPAGWVLDRSIALLGGTGWLQWYSRTITGTEAATYTWTFANSFCSAAAVEWHSTLAGIFTANTGASDVGTGTSGTSRAIGTSAALASSEEAIVAVTSLGTTSAGYSVTGGPTMTEIAAGTFFDHYATGVTAAATALTLTGNWTTSSSVSGQGFQTYYMAAAAPAGGSFFLSI